MSPHTRRRIAPRGRAGGWRLLLPAVLLAVPVLLAACEREGTVADAFPEPIAADTACAVDGMLLRPHPGPKGQIVHADGTRSFYCDVREVFEALHDPEQGHRVARAFVQPMDGRAWAGHDDGWADARELIYVLGSRRMGHMGPTLVPFRERPAAQEFMAGHGGRVVTAADLTAEAVAAYVREARRTLRDMQVGAAPAGNGGGHDPAGTHAGPAHAHTHEPAAPATSTPQH